MSNINSKVASTVFAVAMLLRSSVIFAQGLPQELHDLKGQVDTLTATVSALQSQVSTLQTQLAAVQSNPALAIGPFVTVDVNPENGVSGPHITFKGANIHIVSGSGRTDDQSQLGNLIIGYDELPLDAPLPNGDRQGSHNLVLGRYNHFPVDGNANLIGGMNNTASGVTPVS